MNKRRHILIWCIVGMVMIAGCGNGEGMETNQAVTETNNYNETEENISGTGTDESLSPESMPESTQESTQESVQADVSETEIAQTLERFLQTALMPVGSTMYIWGGGWNEEDTGAGPGAVTLGVCPEWAEFAALQDSDYNYKDHRYEIMNGLDCSGYVGWAVYNLFEEEDGKPGYVFKSTETAAKYSEFGWGTLLENPTGFMTGDIVSMKGHVWISLGMCEDGSVVLMHASPPGVSICGTALENGEKSRAVELAEEYMTKYYPEWQDKYPDREVGLKYLTNVSVMRWNKETLYDAETLQVMSAEEVLKMLFRE